MHIEFQDGNETHVADMIGSKHIAEARDYLDWLENQKRPCWIVRACMKVVLPWTLLEVVQAAVKGNDL